MRPTAVFRPETLICHHRSPYRIPRSIDVRGAARILPKGRFEKSDLRQTPNSERASADNRSVWLTSEEVAREMACGILAMEACSADIVLANTGLAGPPPEG
jgi:hypothetical protein